MQRTGVRAGGAVVLVIGVIAGLVLWLLAGRRYDDAVTDLAPVPIGCTTTLEFERTGTYTFFVETRGSVGEIDGDCEADDRSYDVAADDAPRVTLSLVDDGDDEIDLDRTDGPTYDRAGRRGVGIRTVDIDDTGDYRLTATATSDDAEILVRVGRDPSTGVGLLRVGAVVALVAGLVVGLLLLLVAGRRRPDPAPPTPGGAQWPTSYPARPMAPPNAEVPGAPPYTPRPASHGPYRPASPPADWQPPSRPTSREPDDRPTGGALPPPSPPR